MPDTDPRYGLAALLKPAALMRLGGIAVLLAAAAAAFAWAGGWLAPHRLDRQRIINELEAVNGVHPGFRRNHAKGVCLSGWFDSNGAGVALSRAQVFRPGRVPVFGRFALAGGMPRTADSPAAVRSMALNFTLPDGEVWRTGMNDIPVFPVKDARGFYDQLVANRPDPRTGKPDPAALKAFRAAHPEAVAAAGIIKAAPVSSGFANARYNGLDAFRFIDAAGHVTNVRWSMVPVDAFAAQTMPPPSDHDYLFDALIARIRKGPAQWHLVVTVAAPGDPTDDATLPWPATRRRVDVGTLTITAITAEAAGNCRDINFDPLVLPDGIAPSDDPLLSARSAAYSLSFTRRAREPKTPSAVMPGKGA